MKKSNVVKLVSGYLVGLSCSYLCFELKIQEGASHFKSQNQISKDAESLSADLDVVKVRNDDYVRLRFPKDNSVYVKCDDNVEKKYVKDAISYYNNLFSTINDKYMFELVDNNFTFSPDDVYIEIVDGKTPDRIYGNNVGDIEFKGNLGMFVSNSQIVLNWSKISKLDEIAKRYIVRHEFAHSLGLRDVYLDKENYNYVNTNTFMNVDNMHNVDILYPNYYATLISMYSDAYSECNSYVDAIVEMREAVSNYREYFYDYYSNLIKNKYSSIDNLNEDFINNNDIYWSNDEYTYKLTKIGDKCELTIYDSLNNLIANTTGMLNYSNGMFFIEGLEVDDCSYLSNINSNAPYKFGLSLYFDSNDGVLISNNLGADTRKIEVCKNKNIICRR